MKAVTNKRKPSARRAQVRVDMRSQMLAAAEGLIRETGDVAFSVNELAARAGTSVASLYNIIGTKPTILYTLLNAFMDTISTKGRGVGSNSDPVAAAIATSEFAARIFASDPDFLRPLYRYVLGVTDATHRPAFMARSLRFWLRGLRPLWAAGLLPDEISLEDFAQDHMLFFAGALDQWVHGELDNVQFQTYIRNAAIMRLLIIDDEHIRARLLRSI